MAIPYEFIRVMKGKKPSDLEREKRLPKQQLEFLMQNGNMKGKYLGACLDSSRWGSQTTVMYEIDIKGLINFIQNWTSQNPENFQQLYHEERIEKLYTKFELPHIDYKVCPRNENHKGTVTDLSGRVRCAHKEEKRFRPSFLEVYGSYLDKLANISRLDFVESHPRNLGYDKEDPELQLLLDKWNTEERTAVYADFCYAILSDKEYILPLETILKRLEVTSPFYERQGNTEFPFDGWDLAFYVKKWYEQFPNGQAPLFEK